MTFVQALLIGLLGYCSAKWAIPLWGDMGGWWTCGRPLVAGMLIGIIPVSYTHLDVYKRQFITCLNILKIYQLLMKRERKKKTLW